MKKYLIPFLWILAFAIIIFLFFWQNYNEGLWVNEQEKQHAEISELKAVNEKLLDKNLDLQYFDLNNNEEARSYFDHVPIEDLSAFIKDKLMETNTNSQDHILVPYAGTRGPMVINNTKVLNHKWLIADFSDGRYWGEILVKYEITAEQGVNFTLIDHLLYTN